MVFFAEECYFCIQSFSFSQITVIQIYYVKKSESINPWTMNTDTVEWYFADAQQMMHGSTNK